LLEVQLARKGVLGFGGEEFALRVMGEPDRGCCKKQKNKLMFVRTLSTYRALDVAIFIARFIHPGIQRLQRL
jgi:hypothetical protein